MRIYFFPRWLLTVAALSAWTGSAWCADEAKDAKDAPPQDSAVISHLGELRNGDLKREAALQVKVSFEAKRQPLNELLLNLQKQSGVVLTAAPDSPLTSAIVTAYVQDLSLADVMWNLARLYGVTWTRTTNNSYVMRRSDRSELELRLLRLGDLDAFRIRLLTAIKTKKERSVWVQEVLNSIDKTAVTSPEGVPVSALPSKLLLELRQEKQQLAALRLVEVYSKAMEFSVDGYVLHIETPKPQVQTAKGVVVTSSRAIVRSSDGQPIVPIDITPPAAPQAGNNRL